MVKQITDFSKILTEIRDSGINDYALSDRTGIERSVLSKLRTGKRKQPNYDIGVEIMKVYAEIKK